MAGAGIAIVAVLLVVRVVQVLLVFEPMVFYAEKSWRHGGGADACCEVDG